MSATRGTPAIVRRVARSKRGTGYTATATTGKTTRIGFGSTPRIARASALHAAEWEGRRAPLVG